MSKQYYIEVFNEDTEEWEEEGEHDWTGLSSDRSLLEQEAEDYFDQFSYPTEWRVSSNG
jgi:hypothetical protein